jgi:radical SAM protein with 4Fe4S-binding SPASM domain
MQDLETYVDPITAVWEITLKCNLNCLHCGSSAGKNRSDELSTDEALKLCNDLSDTGFKGITLMGGEVFLRKDWYDISKEIKNLDMALSIISNGFLNPEKVIPHLVNLNVDCLMIGLDGASPETQDQIRNTKGAFKKAKAFVQMAKKADLPVGIITTVHNLNFNDLPKLCDYVLEQGIFWQIQQAVPIGRFSEKLLLSDEDYYSLGLFIHLMQKKYGNEKISFIGNHNLGFKSNIIPNLSPQPEWRGCIAGINIMGIQSNGNIKGCLALSDGFIEGNIRRRGIKEIWNDPDAFSYSRKFNINNLGKNCRECKYGLECKGGCTTRSSSITNSPHNDPFCFHRIEKTMKIKNKSLNKT